MWTTAISLLTFLITNSGDIIKAGQSVKTLVTEVIALITGADAAGRTDLTKDEFNAFVDKALGNTAELDRLISEAKAEIA